MSAAQRSWWGWGLADHAVPAAEVEAMAPLVSQSLGCEVQRREPATLASLQLREPRIAAPHSLSEICSVEVEDRAGHSYGKSFRDVVRGFRGEFPNPPDAVARPRNEAELVSLLDWCGSEGIAAIPYGAGSSVVGGVESGGEWDEQFNGVVSIDLVHLDRVVEVDHESRAALIQAGATGPSSSRVSGPTRSESHCRLDTTRINARLPAVRATGRKGLLRKPARRQSIAAVNSAPSVSGSPFPSSRSARTVHTRPAWLRSSLL